MAIKYPKGIQTTSTQQGIGPGPMDMPDRGGPKPNYQSSSTMIGLTRNPSPVAAFGARPSQGQVITTSEKASLSRSATSPYDNINATKPQTSFGGRGKKK